MGKVKKNNNQTATKRDIQTLKKDIREEMRAMKGGLREEMLDLREGIIDQVNDKMKLYKDEVITRLDGISKELQDMREEDAAGTLQFRRLDGKVEDHEKRITTLESPTQAA